MNSLGHKWPEDRGLDTSASALNLILNLFFTFGCMCVHVCTHTGVQCTHTCVCILISLLLCGGQRITMWVLRIQLRLSGLVPRAFTL